MLPSLLLQGAEGKEEEEMRDEEEQVREEVTSEGQIVGEQSTLDAIVEVGGFIL